MKLTTHGALVMASSTDDKNSRAKSAKKIATTVDDKRGTSLRVILHPTRSPYFDPQSREALVQELTKEWSEELYDG
jgi:hypothetical protein